MLPLTTLWLPILISAVFVFIASNILWQALPFWHRLDYQRLDDDRTILNALTNVKSGQYLTPHGNWNKLSPEEREKRMNDPMAFLLVRNPARFSFPQAIATYFIYLLVVSYFIAYVGAATLPRGTDYLKVFQVIGTAGILAYSFNSIADSIWYGRPWSVTFKVVVDGVIYGLLTAGTFGWLWPR